MRKERQGSYLGETFDLRVKALAVDATRVDECWPWPGFVPKDGYVRVAIRRADGKAVTMVAHKRAYNVLVGEVPQGKQLDHLCRNRSCFNPKHLEPVTQRVNVRRGTGNAAKNATKTHCKRGHPLTEGNLLSSGARRGWRNCCQCIREQDRERRRKKRRERGLRHAPGYIPPLKPLVA